MDDDGPKQIIYYQLHIIILHTTHTFTSKYKNNKCCTPCNSSQAGQNQIRQRSCVFLLPSTHFHQIISKSPYIQNPTVNHQMPIILRSSKYSHCSNGRAADICRFLPCATTTTPTTTTTGSNHSNPSITHINNIIATILTLLMNPFQQPRHIPNDSINNTSIPIFPEPAQYIWHHLCFRSLNGRQILECFLIQVIP